MEGFRGEAQERLDKLRTDAFESPMAEDLTHLARSEIFDSLGDMARARSELGYTSRPPAEALARAARWFVDEGMVRSSRVALIRWSD